VVHFYPDYVEGFSSGVLQTLLSRSFGMNPTMRMAFMKAFMRLKTRDLIPLDKAIDIAFKLHRCQDKQVRQTMRNFVVHDIKRLNLRQKMHKVNSLVQSHLAKLLKDNNPTVAREAVFVLLRLFRKNVWNDARTANLIAEACLAKRKKVYAPAVRFFLGQDKTNNEKDSDSESEPDTHKETKIRQLRLGHRVGCKTKNRQKRLERSIEHINKVEARKAAKGTNLAHFAAINLLHDPQAFAERLFRKLEHCSDRFEIRLLLLDLVTRLIGLHKLLVLNLYPFIQRFLRPHQREVTRLLLFTAQASHDEVPPDVMEPVIRTIADNFVTERASSEAIAVGLNAVREICARCPYGISQDLLSDLVQYRTYKNKNVVASARSLIRLYREINPSALPRKERGRPTEAQLETMIEGQTFSGLALSFGQTTAAKFVPGAEALVLAETLAKQSRREDRNNSGSSKRMIKDDKETKNTEERLNAEGVDADANDEDSEACGEVNKSSRITQKKDDGWIDVPQSSDDDETEVSDTAKPKIDPSELASKALEIASSRIFTQEEFEAMRRYQLNKQKRFAAMGSRNKRKAEDDSEFLEIDSEEDEADGDKANSQLVTMSAITRLVKRPRQSKAERLEAIQDGRAGREKYGYKVNRMNPHASTTNREKSKGKTFQMIKHKVRQKAKRSFRDKQIALRDQLRHMLKHMR
ncbi:SDA1 domain containing 1, partial [Clonorchis sinensis]